MTRDPPHRVRIFGRRRQGVVLAGRGVARSRGYRRESPKGVLGASLRSPVGEALGAARRLLLVQVAAGHELLEVHVVQEGHASEIRRRGQEWGARA